MAIGAIVMLGHVIARVAYEIALLLAAIALAVLTFALFILRGLLWIVNRLLPWLLRLACLDVWVYGLYAAFQGVAELYGAMADAPAKVLLGVAVAVGVIASPVIVLFKRAEYVWPGFVFGGLVGIVVLVVGRVIVGLPALYPAVGVLPPVLTGVLLVYLTLRGKQLRRERNVRGERIGQTDLTQG